MFYDENEKIVKCHGSTGKMSQPTLFCHKNVWLSNVRYEVNKKV